MLINYVEIAKVSFTYKCWIRKREVS